MIVSNLNQTSRIEFCKKQTNNQFRFEIGEYPKISTKIKYHDNMIYLEKDIELRVFSKPDFKGDMRIYYGNKHNIYVDIDIQSLSIKENKQALVMCLKIQNNKNNSQSDVLWFPCGVFSNSNIYGFKQNIFMQYYYTIDNSYELQPFQSGIQIVSKNLTPQVIIEIQNQTPIKLYLNSNQTINTENNDIICNNFIYSDIQFPSFSSITLLNSNIKLEIKPIDDKANKSEYLIIYDSIQCLNPMTSLYKLEIKDKIFFDKFAEKILNIHICNNQTKKLLYNSIIIVLMIISINVILHTFYTTNGNNIQKKEFNDRNLKINNSVMKNEIMK